MEDNIINQEVNSTSVVNEDNLFELVENNLNDSEKIDAPAYSYWRSVIKSFFRNPGNIICISLFIFYLFPPTISSLLNIYKQLIEENFPHLKGRIKLGGLIKFNVYYPNPNNAEYRLNPNNKKQLQIKDGDEFVNIEDYTGDYMIPTILDINDENVIIDVKEKDYRDTIKSLPKLSTEDKIDIQGTESLMSEEEQENYNDYIDDLTDFDDLDLEDDDYNSDDYDTRSAVTDLIVEGNLTSAEIYAQDIVNGNTDNAFGIKVVTDLNNFIESFPQQYRGNIRKMLDSDELNYTCS